MSIRSAWLLSATTAALLLCAAAAPGQNVEFRIVERRGQTSWMFLSPTSIPFNDNIFDFTVQARVVGTSPTLSLASFSFNITTTSGEAENRGTLELANISNADGTYNTGANRYLANATVGQGGIAAAYAHSALSNPDFNGLINRSGGSYINNPAEQDIGLVTGTLRGASLLLVTDPDHTGNPATYPGTGTTAPIDEELARGYFGANNQFVDVYHFRYLALPAGIDLRVVHIQLQAVTASVCTEFALQAGVWGPANPTFASVSTGSGFNFQIGTLPTPGTAMTLLLAGATLARRHRATAPHAPRADL